jgi:hypothetical protein
MAEAGWGRTDDALLMKGDAFSSPPGFARASLRGVARYLSLALRFFFG